jgi:hypothetical protein
MIEPVINALEPLVNAELARARAEYGATFASMHEGFGVLAEEVQEAEEALHMVDVYKDVLLHMIRIGAPVDKIALEVEAYALEAAAELVQVAAMCRKMSDCRG